MAKTDQELQELYAEARRRGMHKSDPELGGLLAEAVKRGLVQDLSGGSEPVRSSSAGQGDVRRQEALETPAGPKITSFPKETPFSSVLQPTPVQGDAGALKALQAQYGKDVQGQRPSNILPLETPGTKRLSEPASGTLLPLLAGGVLAPLIGGGLAGGLATGALAGAGASARAAQIGGALAGAAGGMGTGMLAQPIAEQFARATDPEGMAQIERGRAGVREASPTADILLNTLPSLLIGKPSLRPGLIDATLGAGIGGAQEGYQQFKEGRFDPQALLASMGTNALMSGRLTREGQALASRPTETGAKVGVAAGYLGREGAKRVRANREANTDQARAAKARNVTNDAGETTAPPPASARKTTRPGNLIGGETAWKVTDYGQSDKSIEKTPDRNSVVLRKGAWENGLDKDSVAVSPDVEAQLRAANIKPHDWVEFTLANGKTVVKRWDDRTADNLKGRVDFFNPSAIDPNRGAAVTGFTRVGKGKPLPLGSNPSASTIPQAPSDSQTSVATAPPKPLKTTEEVIAEASAGLAPATKPLGEAPKLRPQPSTSPVEPSKSADATLLPVAPETPPKAPVATKPKTSTGYEQAEIDRARKEFNVKPEESVDGVAYTSDNQPVPYRWKVVEADSLVASHTPDLQPNSAYPQELQPRDRTNSATSWNQINKLASDMNPVRLGYSNSAIDGAPIVGADNLVESGNGRTLSIQSVYTRPELVRQKEKYERFVREYSQSLLGMDTAGIKNPVLVRERAGALDLPKRAELAQRMNSGSVMQRTRGESAEFDASRMEASGALGSYQLGSGLGDASSRGFVEQFFKDLPTEELTQVFDDRTRTINKTGEDRILSALVAYAYKSAPEGEAIIKTVASGADDGIGKNLARSMTESAPDFAKLAYEQSRGAFDFPKEQGGKGDYDLAPELASAARSLASFKSRGEARGWIEQQKTGDLLGGALTDQSQIAVMETLAQDVYSKSAAKTTELLRKYAELAYKAGTEQSLDGSARPSKIELFKKADAIVRGVTREEGQKGFDFAETPKPTPVETPKPAAPETATSGVLSNEERERRFLATYSEQKQKGYGKPPIKVAQENLSALTESPFVYHQTSTANAVGVLSRVRQGFRDHTSLWVSDNPDLALGQKGAAVTIVFKSNLVNGFKNTLKPGLDFTESKGAGTEFNLDKTVKRSIEKVIVRTDAAYKKISESFPSLVVEMASGKKEPVKSVVQPEKPSDSQTETTPVPTTPKTTDPVTPSKAVESAAKRGMVDLESMTAEDILALKKRGKSKEAVSEAQKRIDNALDTGPC